MSTSCTTCLNFTNFSFNMRYAVKISSTGIASFLLTTGSLLRCACAKYYKGEIRFLLSNSFNGLQIACSLGKRVMLIEESIICTVPTLTILP